MVIYLDIIFLENILMNYIIIFTTGIVLKENFKKRRIFLGSVIGAIYTIVMYLNIIPIYSNFIMKLILSFSIIYISFNPKTVKKLIRYMVIFYLVSFVFGGCVFALMYFLKPQMIQIRNGVFVGTYPIKIAVFGGIVAFVVLQIGFKMVKTKFNKKDMIYQLKITINQKSIKVKGLLDTGNLLREPITGIPVIVVENKCLFSIIPKEIIDKLSKIMGGDADDIVNKEEFNTIIPRVRMIPFSSIGKQNGLLLGIKADCVSITVDEKIKNIENVIIGIYDKSFTKNQMYSAIFGLDILEGGSLDECVSNVKI